MGAIRAGTALTQVGPDGKHLWFVLTDPDAATKKVVTVMLVTARLHTDKTVILLPGSHPFIVRESNVHYGSADFVPLSTLRRKLETRRAFLQKPMDAKLLKVVRKGLLLSGRTRNYISDYCRPLF